MAEIWVAGSPPGSQGRIQPHVGTGYGAGTTSVAVAAGASSDIKFHDKEVVHIGFCPYRDARLPFGTSHPTNNESPSSTGSGRGA